MERKSAKDFDPNVLILFDAYVHGAKTPLGKALKLESGEGFFITVDIPRISLEGKDGVPAPVIEPGKDGIDRIHKVETPALELFPTTQKPARGTIMVCPGGGYGILAINHEGYFVAQKLNEFGYDVAILLYHVSAGNETRELALADAKTALADAEKRLAEDRQKAATSKKRRDEANAKYVRAQQLLDQAWKQP